MAESLQGSEPLAVVDVDQLLEQVQRLSRQDLVLCVKLALLGQSMELFKCICSEWHRANQHHVEADTCAPHVSLEPAVALAAYDLWGDVGRGATLVEHAFLFGGDLF